MAAPHQPSSPNRKAWRRFRRNVSAMFGLSVVLLSVFFALLAYVIAPDNSPSANQQILPLETHPPGFSIRMLHLRKTRASTTHIADGLLNGFDKNYEPVPVLAYTTEADSIKISEYRGRAFRAVERKISYADLLGYSSLPANKEERQQLAEQQIETRTYLLGTDKFGRDILSRLLIGVRVSLSVGLISVFISLAVGVVLGACAGYFGGLADEIIMWLINVFWSIPTLLLAMGLYISAGSLVENKLVMIFVAVGFTMWVETARLVRGQFLAIRDLEFVTAAHSLGFGHFRIIFRHILPNITGPIIVVACANFASAILVESGLSYIGLGIQPPAPSWGSMLNEYKDFIDTDKAYLALFPGLAIMLMVLAFNLVGNGLRDALDVKGKTE